MFFFSNENFIQQYRIIAQVITAAQKYLLWVDSYFTFQREYS